MSVIHIPVNDSVITGAPKDLVAPFGPLQLPVGQCRINWDHPMTRNLEYCLVLNGYNERDLVWGNPIQKTNLTNKTPTTVNSFRGYKFDGALGSSVIRLQHPGQSNMSGPLTVAAVYQVAVGQNGQQMHVVAGSGGPPYAIRHAGWNNRRLEVSRQWTTWSHSDSGWLGATAIYRTIFSHVGGTSDAGSMKLGYNGNFQDLGVGGTETISSTDGNPYIGNYTSVSQEHYGNIYFLCAWKREMEKPEMMRWMAYPAQFLESLL